MTLEEFKNWMQGQRIQAAREKDRYPHGDVSFGFYNGAISMIDLAMVELEKVESAAPDRTGSRRGYEFL